MTLFAVICAGIYPILHLGRPWFFYWMFPYPATMDVWPQFRSPLEWDIWAVLTYLIVSIVFWYIGLVPDLAAARDRATKPRLAGILRHARARLARLGEPLDALAPGLSADWRRSPCRSSSRCTARFRCCSPPARSPAGTRRSSRPISCSARRSRALPWCR